MSATAPYTFTNICFAALGVFILWNKLGKTQLAVWGMGRTWELFVSSKKVREVCEFVSFLILGTILSLFLTQPVSTIQAFSAGLGWTGLFTVPKKSQR
jgi:prepilin signal peptidase PulO-like enzyme (type II secretory pathway)